MMNVTVEIGWKFVAALGAAAGLIILAVKTDRPAAERVLTHVVDASKGKVSALNSAD